MIVFDSSPLIHLTKINKIKYVIKLFGKINIPAALYNEVVTVGIKNNRYDAKIIENYVKKEEINVQNISVSKLFKNILHPGEREALSLAKKRGALLIMDEKKARFIAHQNNIYVHGTLGVLLILLKEKIIDKNHYLENLKLYADQGWISIGLYQKFRDEV